MKQPILQRMAIGIVGFMLMVLITACAGVSSAQKLTGSVIMVSVANHSVTLNVGGQMITIKGLTDQEVTELQGLAGKISSVSIQATQNGDGSYTLVAGQQSITITSSNGTPVTGSNGTPAANSTPAPNEPGKISIIGTAQSAIGSSVVVTLPDGQELTININDQTKMDDFNGLPSTGQTIKVDATASQSDGSFTATELKKADPGDLQNQDMSFQGITSSAVEADNIIHLRIGNQDFSFTIVPGTTELKNFTSPQSIGANASVTVTVRFQGTTATVKEVKNENS